MITNLIPVVVQVEMLNGEISEYRYGYTKDELLNDEKRVEILSKELTNKQAIVIYDKKKTVQIAAARRPGARI